MEETVWAMSDMVTNGQALYWGTSEWSADQIRQAIDIADRHHLHTPVTEQSEYNLLNRRKVERGYARLHADTGYGNTTFSPLASGLLTGKYRDGVPEGRAPRSRDTSGSTSAPATDDHRTDRAPATDRRAARLHDGTTRVGLDDEAPDGVERDHRREQRRTGPFELRRTRRDPADHRRRQGRDRSRHRLSGRSERVREPTRSRTEAA